MAVRDCRRCSSGPAARWWPRSWPPSPWHSPGSGSRAACSGRGWRVVAGGVVVGFPLLTSFALTTAPASHGAVVIALLPAATATAAVLRGRERPPPAFWVITGVGALAAIGFASMQSGGFGQLHWADLLLLGAVVAAAVGYAEGGLLARELGAWQTVSWALVLASPLMVFLAAFSVAQQPPSATPVQWAAFAYLGVVSMFLGFFAWYRGLAIGPMAQVSQVQLVQPVLSICWAGLLLGETLTLDHHPRRPGRHPLLPAPPSASGSIRRPLHRIPDDPQTTSILQAKEEPHVYSSPLRSRPRRSPGPPHPAGRSQPGNHDLAAVCSPPCCPSSTNLR